MPREEYSPIFTEEALYGGPRTRGRKKLIIGVITVGAALLLTLAIAIPLSSNQNTVDNSSEKKLMGLSLQSGVGDMDRHYYQEGEDSMDKEQKLDSGSDENKELLDTHRLPWRHRTKRPWNPYWPTRGTTEEPEETTTEETSSDNEEDSNSTSRHSKHCKHGRHHWHPDHHFPPWYPWPHSRRPWWPTRRTTPSASPPTPASPPTSTSHPTSTSSTSDVTEEPEGTTTNFIPTFPPKPPKWWECPEISQTLASRLQLDNYVNMPWHEVARVQSSEVEFPITLISCSTVFVEVDKVGDQFTPEGAQAIYTWKYPDESNRTLALNLTATEHVSQWLVVSEDDPRMNIQLSFLVRSNDYLLSYECLAFGKRRVGYVIRVLSLDPEEEMDFNVRSMLWLADSLGLNPEKLEAKSISQRNC